MDEESMHRKKEIRLRTKTRRVLQAAMGVWFVGLVVYGASPAGAGTMWNQQALLLVHIPVGGQVFTSNFVFTASGNATSITVKCYNDSGNRIGPPAGINISFSAANQVSQQTPATLGVTTDPLFASGAGWCWASSPGSTFDFNVQATYGATSDLTPGGILNSPGASFIGHSPGSTETTASDAGIPIWTMAGGAQNFLVLLNPLKRPVIVNVGLFDTSGIAQGTAPLTRILNPRTLVVLTVPSSFGLTSPPTTGSINITVRGPGEYLGWSFQEYPNGRAVFNQIGLDGGETRGTLVLGLPASRPSAP
jgi:hypothetical protein